MASRHATMAGMYVLNTAIKLLVLRRGPALPGLPQLTGTPTQFSFPSAHAATSFAGALCYSRLGSPLPLYALAASLSMSRLYLGVHYPSDVLAGALLGTAVGGCVTTPLPPGAGAPVSTRIGIVGMPNAGKSSLFNALTKAGAEAANYPFTTIEPNVAVVPVRDERLEEVARTVGASEIVWDTVDFHDIAGLVAGAHEGEGSGNRFLANIRETDAIVHVVRAHGDENVVHPEGRVDPLADIETIETELVMADLERPNAAWSAWRAGRGGDRVAIAEEAWLSAVIEALKAGRPARACRRPRRRRTPRATSAR